MRTYSYKAKSSPQKVERGLLEAENRLGALDKISQMGYFPISVEEHIHANSRRTRFSVRKKVSQLDLSQFSRQLADLVESGIPLLKALEVIKEQTDNPSLNEIIDELCRQVRGGKPLSEAMQSFPQIFSPVYISLVGSGELGGALGPALSRLSDYAESEDELRAKVFSALAYPSLILMMGLGTVIFLVSFVVPRLAGMFADMGQSLPLITRILIQISGIITGYWWVGLLVLSGMLIAWRLGNIQTQWKLLLDKSLLRLPLWGTLIKKVEIARFSRTLGLLLNGGVPILEALRVVIGMFKHPVLQIQVQQATQSVQEGSSLAESLKEMPDFPAFVCNMISVGEEGNILEKSLQKVAITFERQADRAMKTMTTLLEPLMIIVVGLMIGLIVIAIFLPIFQINTFIR